MRITVKIRNDLPRIVIIIVAYLVYFGKWEEKIMEERVTEKYIKHAYKTTLCKLLNLRTQSEIIN